MWTAICHCQTLHQFGLWIGFVLVSLPRSVVLVFLRPFTISRLTWLSTHTNGGLMKMSFWRSKKKSNCLWHTYLLHQRKKNIDDLIEVLFFNFESFGIFWSIWVSRSLSLQSLFFSGFFSNSFTFDSWFCHFSFVLSASFFHFQHVFGNFSTWSFYNCSNIS